MPIVQLLVIICLVGFVLWLINTMVPLQPPFKTILNAVVCVVFLLWLLSVFGVLHMGPVIKFR